MTPLHKKGKKDKKNNYRPVSILPTLPKCFEKCMFSQMSAYFDEMFSKYQYGFRKVYSSQQCILALLEKWKAAVDKGKVFGALLCDFSKAFDCLNHELLVAKLNAYRFTLPALKLVHDYLSDRKKRTRVNNSYSTWSEILFGVTQGSILGPLLFNIFLADLFFILSEIDIANYADDNMPYTSSNDVNGLIKSLEKASKKLIKWFNDNLRKSNPDECHLLVSRNDKVKIRIGNLQTDNTKREKLLGMQFDNKLSFDYHLSETYKKASRKLYALGRVTPYINLSKRKILMNAFFNSQFSYFPLIWMCHSSIIHKKINRLDERCLRMIYCDKQSSFEELLLKDSSVSIHERNIQILATELYRVSKDLILRSKNWGYGSRYL